jgi:aspartokinase
MKSITDELVKINNSINVERRSRDESEQSIFEMLKDVVNRVKLELDQEKKIREETEEHLLSLLEDTCNKLSTAANL